MSKQQAVQYLNPANNQRVYAICDGIEFDSLTYENAHALEGRIYATVRKEIHWIVSVGYYKDGPLRLHESPTSRIFVRVFRNTKKDSAFKYAVEKMKELIAREQ